MRRFEFRLIPAIATLIGAALFLRLGWWQWDKAGQVEAAVQAVEARAGNPPLTLGAALVDAMPAANMPVEARGEYEADGQFYIDNQQEHDVPGVHVITPLRIAGSDTRVLVNRGWVAWGASRETLPKVAVPQGDVVVHGIAQLSNQKKRRFVSEELGNTEQLKTRLDLERYRQEAKHPVQPVVILQDPKDAEDGLVRHWAAPENKTTMHRGYALQWLLITVALVIFFVVTSFRKAES